MISVSMPHTSLPEPAWQQTSRPARQRRVCRVSGGGRPCGCKQLWRLPGPAAHRAGRRSPYPQPGPRRGGPSWPCDGVGGREADGEAFECADGAAKSKPSNARKQWADHRCTIRSEQTKPCSWTLPDQRLRRTWAGQPDSGPLMPDCRSASVIASVDCPAIQRVGRGG